LKVQQTNERVEGGKNGKKIRIESYNLNILNMFDVLCEWRVFSAQFCVIFFIVFLIAKAFDGLCVFLAPLPPAYANPKPSEHS
jgi:hypothetical protein